MTITARLMGCFSLVSVVQGELYVSPKHKRKRFRIPTGSEGLTERRVHRMFTDVTVLRLSD